MKVCTGAWITGASHFCCWKTSLFSMWPVSYRCDTAYKVRYAEEDTNFIVSHVEPWSSMPGHFHLVSLSIYFHDPIVSFEGRCRAKKGSPQFGLGREGKRKSFDMTRLEEKRTTLLQLLRKVCN